MDTRTSQKLSDHAKTQPRKRGKFAERSTSVRASAAEAHDVNFGTPDTRQEGSAAPEPLPASRILHLIAGMPKFDQRKRGWDANRDVNWVTIRRGPEGTTYCANGPNMILRIVDEGACGPVAEATVTAAEFRAATRGQDKGAVLEWHISDAGGSPTLTIGSETLGQARGRPAPRWDDGIPESCWKNDPPTLDQWEELAGCLEFASDDRTRPVLCGAHFPPKGELFGGEMVTTDSYRLAVATPPVEMSDHVGGNNVDSAAMRQFAKTARKMVGKTSKADPVSPAVSFGIMPAPGDESGDTPVVTMECGNVALQTRCIEGEYPNLKLLFAENPVEAALIENPSEVADWLKPAAAHEKKHRGARAVFSVQPDGKVALTYSFQEEQGNKVEESHGTLKQGPGWTIYKEAHFNAEHLSDALKWFGADRPMSIRFPGHTEGRDPTSWLPKPAIFTEQGKSWKEPGKRILQMPIRN